MAERAVTVIEDLIFGQHIKNVCLFCIQLKESQDSVHKIKSQVSITADVIQECIC